MNTEENGFQTEDVFTNEVNEHSNDFRREEEIKEIEKMLLRSKDKTSIQSKRNKKEISRREFLKYGLTAIGAGAAAILLKDSVMKIASKVESITEDSNRVAKIIDEVKESYNLLAGNLDVSFTDGNLKEIYDEFSSKGFSDYEIAYVAYKQGNDEFLSLINEGAPTYRKMLEQELKNYDGRGELDLEAENATNELETRNYLRLYSDGFVSHVNSYVNSKNNTTSVNEVEEAYQKLASNLDVSFGNDNSVDKISNPKEIEEKFKAAGFIDFEISYIAHRQGNDYFHQLIVETFPSYKEFLSKLANDNNIDVNDSKKVEECVIATLEQCGFVSHVDTYINNLTIGRGR